MIYKVKLRVFGKFRLSLRERECDIFHIVVAKSLNHILPLRPHGQPGFPVRHHLPERAQTHVHLVGDAIQPPHPLSAPSPPAFNLSQHQGLFQ